MELRLGVLLAVLVAAAPAAADHPYNLPIDCPTEWAGGVSPTPPLSTAWTRMPITVYIDPVSQRGVPGGTERDYKGAVERAMAIWERATKSVVRFTTTPFEGEADIEVTFFERSGTVLGTSTGPNPGGVTPVRIGVPPVPNFIQVMKTSVHEFGHALGLGHGSQGSLTVLPPVHEAELLANACPGPGDVATLKTLYGELGKATPTPVPEETPLEEQIATPAPTPTPTPVATVKPVVAPRVTPGFEALGGLLALAAVAGLWRRATSR